VIRNGLLANSNLEFMEAEFSPADADRAQNKF